VHVLGCFILALLTFAIGITPSKKPAHGTRIVAFAGILYIAVQMPVSLIRLHATMSPCFQIEDPIKAYINFFWSPMCTVIILWLYLSHAAHSCKTCRMMVSCQNIDPYFKEKRFLLMLLFGIGTSWCAYTQIGPFFDLHPEFILRVLFGISLACAPLEILYIRARYNKIQFFSNTWIWYFGMWLYFIPCV
jgi:hypothetical protein